MVDRQMADKIISDCQEISDAIIDIRVYEKIRDLVVRVVPFMVEEIQRQQQLQNLVYRTMFEQNEEKEQQILYNEIVAYFKNQQLMPDEEEETQETEEDSNGE